MSQLLLNLAFAPSWVQTEHLLKLNYLLGLGPLNVRMLASTSFQFILCKTKFSTNCDETDYRVVQALEEASMATFCSCDQHCFWPYAVPLESPYPQTMNFALVKQYNFMMVGLIECSPTAVGLYFWLNTASLAVDIYSCDLNTRTWLYSRFALVTHLL